MAPPIQTFQVSIKAFLWHEERLLLVQDRGDSRAWELPGGRIDVGEEQLLVAEVLRRELREELGEHFACTIGAPCACWLRPRAPHLAHPVFLLGLLCTEPRGEIVLSEEHVAQRWVRRDEWQDLPLVTGYPAALAAFFAAR
jgi:8-oxo-dGTP pyrophosphatase MutT (NUDIX family)